MAQLKLWRSESDRGLLPPVCVVCGEHTDDTKTIRFTWTPGWVWIMLFCGGLLPLFIVYMITRKSMQLRLPVCPDHQGHWFRRQTAPMLAVLGAIVSGIGLMIAAANLFPDPDAVGIVGLATLLGTVAALVFAGVLQRGCVRPTKIGDGTITLTSLSRTFADALQDDRDREDEAEFARTGRRFRPPAD